MPDGIDHQDEIVVAERLEPGPQPRLHHRGEWSMSAALTAALDRTTFLSRSSDHSP